MAKRKIKNNLEEIEFTLSSGNVYEDFGLPNAEEAKTKAELAMLITEIIKGKGFTQQQAAELMNIDQPKVSKIKFILALGFDIEITPKPHTVKSTLPSMHIISKRFHQPRLSA
jgi:predicted XRE-type DNA-binding protein